MYDGSTDKLIAGSGNDILKSKVGDDTLLGSTTAGSMTTMTSGSGDVKFKGRESNASIVAARALIRSRQALATTRST